MARHYNFFLPSNFKNALTSVLLFSFMGFHQLGFTQDLPSNVPTDGLIGWWPFNGNANDESGNGNHGTVMNNPTLTSDRFNETGSAYYFDGADDFIWLNYLTALNGTSQLTLSYWINSDLSFPPNFVQDGNYGYVFSHWISNSMPGGAIGFQLAHQSDGGIRVAFEGGQNSFSNTLITNINTWNNFVIVYNGVLNSSERVSLYKNGNFVQHIVDPNHIPSFIGTASTRTYIGAAVAPIGNNQAWAFFKGKIDDVGVWNRALTEEEVLGLYQTCNSSVSTQPTDQNTAIGGTAVFTVESSEPDASYQWQTDIGFGFQNLSNAGQYSGVTTSTLTVSNVTESNIGQLFRCVLTSGACVVDSETATIYSCPAITTNLSNQSQDVGNNAVFTVSSSDPQANYQWQTDIGLGFQNLNNAGQYSGTTTNTLTVSNITTANHNQLFRCVITSESCTLTSDVATLTVNGVVNIKEHDTESLFSVYPNPASNYIQLKSDRQLVGLSFTIYDLNGKLVRSAKILSENMVVDLSELAGGVYVVKVGNELKRTFKVIKN